MLKSITFRDRCQAMGEATGFACLPSHAFELINMWSTGRLPERCRFAKHEGEKNRSLKNE
jgi:hypothetical protein